MLVVNSLLVDDFLHDRFVIDLKLREEHEGFNLLSKCPAALGAKALAAHERSSTAMPSSSTVSAQQQQQQLVQKKQARAMALATKPGQQILMNAFMMYMSGKHLNIFSISITTMAIISPLQAILSVDKMFGSLKDVDVQLPKLIFVALNMAWLLLGVYKMSSMRLLPTTSADWTGSIVWKEMMERSSIPPVWQ